VILALGRLSLTPLIKAGDISQLMALTCSFLAKMIKRHWSGILQWKLSSINNGILEGLNLIKSYLVNIDIQ
jgi:hypothetical protein